MDKNTDDYRIITPWGPVPPCPGSRTWPFFMHLALQEARHGAEAGEVPVGALVVGRKGDILAAAHNETRTQNDPTAHAEVVALRRAARAAGNFRLGGCVMIVTLEPCLMCTGAIREARLDGVVYGAADSRAGAVFSRTEGLVYTGEESVPWSYGGVEAEACVKILRDFFRFRRQ